MIQNLHDAIQTQLEGNATLASAGIYFLETPHDEKPESTDGYIRWTATFGDNLSIHKGEIEESEVTISIFSRSLATIDTLHKETIRTMDDCTLSISTADFISCHRSNGHLPPDRERDTRLYHQAIIYQVRYE